MTADTFNSLAAGADRGELVTRGEFYRALWIQGAGVPKSDHLE